MFDFNERLRTLMDMKTAFVHDWIVHEGGAEAVLRHLIETHTFSEGKIFVLFSTHEKLRITNYELEITTALPGWINSVFIYFNSRKVPILSALFDYRNLMFWFPLLCRMLRKKIEKYSPGDIVISSFAAAKNVIRPVSLDNNNKYRQAHHRHKGPTSRPVSTLYLHSPMQYIRENYKENMQKLRFPIKQFYQLATKFLRPRDKLPRHYDTIYFNSKYTEELAKHLYGMKGQIMYPKIEKAFFEEPIVDTPKNYFIFVGRVQRYVREIQKVITLCNDAKENLIIIGDGPDMAYAKSIAGNTITFVGQIQNIEEKIRLMKHARGCINLAKESFGLVTAEALCLGVPVLGYNAGGSKELIGHTNGLLVQNKDKQSLHDGLMQFIKTSFDRNLIANNAREKFS